jgi:hypothetical protein
MDTEAGLWVVMRRVEFEDAGYVAAIYASKAEADAYAAEQEATEPEEKNGWTRYWKVDGPFTVR